MTESKQKNCDLCGLPVEVPDFRLMTIAGPKQFCCEGCYGIFRMLHEAEIVGDGEVPLSDQD